VFVGRVDLGALLESVAVLLNAHAKRQGVTITRVPANAWVEVTGHADSLQQVILNLATNALEAMRDGGALRLELATDGEEAVLTVSDTGTGIPSELQQRIWDLSFSTKPLGRGIGLHVAKQVVLAHGGRVDLSSSTEGARFVVRLPRAR
jgi:signal transduction histidine kinase